MKKPILIILLLLSAFITQAQKKDTTVYYCGCRIKGDTTTYVGAKKQMRPEVQVPDCAYYSAPNFPGGEKAFFKFIHKNLRWPKTEEDVSGKVFVDFIIEKNGSLSYIKITHSLTPAFNSEALRVVKLSSRWIPAKIKGKPVRCRYTIPISFTLNN